MAFRSMRISKVPVKNSYCVCSNKYVDKSMGKDEKDIFAQASFMSFQILCRSCILVGIVVNMLQHVVATCHLSPISGQHG